MTSVHQMYVIPKGMLDIDKDLQYSEGVYLSYYAPLPLTVIYLYMIKVWIPKKMRDRKAMSLKNTMLVYNTVQILYNIYIVKKCFDLMGISLIYLWSSLCSPVTDVNNGLNMRKEIDAILFYYYSNKMLDLLDTIFFALRKKTAQITFLHLIHHVLVIWVTWMNVFYIKDELNIRFVAMNTTVHVLMYIYYFLAGIGVPAERYLWWKKYLTTIQILQFIAAISMLTKLIFDGCKPSPLFVISSGLTGLLFLVLFIDFYRQAYSKRNKLN